MCTCVPYAYCIPILLRNRFLPCARNSLRFNVDRNFFAALRNLPLPCALCPWVWSELPVELRSSEAEEEEVTPSSTNGSR